MASSSPIGQKMPKCPKFTGSQLTRLTPSWSVSHISTSDLVGLYLRSGLLLARIGEVFTGQVVQSCPWTSMETSIFNFGTCTWLVAPASASNIADRRRYWEDTLCEDVLPKVDGELDNSPGKGRIERLTHDDYRYNSTIISPSNRSVSFYLLLMRPHGYSQTDGVRLQQGKWH